MLEIKNLNASINNNTILKNFSLNVNPSEIHIIMGKNGSGKSTLGHVISKNKIYDITFDKFLFMNQDCSDFNTQDMVKNGYFHGFQSPVGIPGLTTSYFLKSCVNSVRKLRNQEEEKLIDFSKRLKILASDLEIDKDMLKRPLNLDFSGGEKKRLEILQMLLIEPELVLLDEIDSGLDVNGTSLIGNVIKKYLENNSKRSMILIVHWTRMLNYLPKTHSIIVHKMINGKIVETGDLSLAYHIEENGYV